MTRFVIIAGALLIASSAHAQTPLQLNSTPSGAAVPSAQQTTGTTANAPHGADRPLTPTGAPSEKVVHPGNQTNGSVPGTAIDGGKASTQGVR